MIHFHADLLRHGDTGCAGFRGVLDDALLPEGSAAMALTLEQARKDNHLPWQKVITSPMRRCAGFARDFAAQHQLPLVIDTRLKEFDFGAWEGKTAADLMENQADALAQFWADPWQYTPPGAETMHAFSARIKEAFDALAKEDLRPLIITHGGVIRLALCLAGQVSRKDFLSYEVPHASLHSVQFQNTFSAFTS